MNPTLSSTSPFTTDSTHQAAQWLRSGRLLAYPTESVWGIGCDPFNESAVRQLLAIKHRDAAKGMIVVTDSIERIAPLLEPLTAQQQTTILTSWHIPSDAITQQAHTWLLPIPQSSSEQLKPAIPTWITGAHSSVAVRIIAHPLIKQLCAQMVSTLNPYGFIVSTSCNPSGQLPALTLAQAQDYFQEDAVNEVHYLTGETLGYELPSQIHDALTGQVIR